MHAFGMIMGYCTHLRRAGPHEDAVGLKDLALRGLQDLAQVVGPPVQVADVEPRGRRVDGAGLGLLVEGALARGRARVLRRVPLILGDLAVAGAVLLVARDPPGGVGTVPQLVAVVGALQHILVAGDGLLALHVAQHLQQAGHS